MEYRDLIQFEPVTEVIQLRLANEKEQAARLISTFVISDRMADVILHRILPALRIDPGQTGRGLFIVGNYGTGKSHLMSVISAAAEHADLAESVNHPSVASGLRAIAGKFKVVRQETSSTEMHLRDLVLRDLEMQLSKIGVEFHFPSMDQTVSNKQLLVEMMEQFDRVYPGQGLLIALDELLDFLRMRKDQQLIMDLNFLREIGEACEIVPLRFMTGVQEALFDNPRFQFAADSIRRVRSRFDQVAIVREDLAYVVSHRLLVKTEAQRRLVRTHLEKFTPLYISMAERLDQFVDLFPVHPAYLEVFEQVTIGERRDLLKALSTQMTDILDKDVPTDQPGLIAFDSYWRTLCLDAAYRTIPEVRTVQDKANVLAERIRQSPSMKEYREPALRIIDALALHRLTLGDLYAPLGITPTELRDRLCLHIPIPEEDADFLLATIESVLNEISRTVSGQFITHNNDNNQYYLDLKKDIDYDALIDQRADSLESAALDRYFFDVLARALEMTDSSYVPGFRIWQREIPWSGHGITRQGYIFLGAPNERSTAHPERDFYLHFLALYGNGKETTQNRSDEVYFLLTNRDAAFESQIKRFAGAREMSAISAGSNKDQYDRKADLARSQLTTWLRENLLRAFQVRYAGETLSVPEVIARHRISLRELPFRDQVFRLGGALLAEHFDTKFPHYPRFEGVEFSVETARIAAEGALRAISGGPATRPVQAVLEGLGLAHFEAGRLSWTVEDSIYAQYFLGRIEALEEGRVINRSELVQGESGAERDVEFKLEPEWVLLVLAALVRQGALTINLPGLRVADGELDAAVRLGFDQLWRFTSISKPKTLPEQALRELFSGLGLNSDVIGDPRALEGATNQLQQQILTELEKTVRLLEDLRDGPRFWREMVLPAVEQQATRKVLEDYRQFLNGLQHLSTPARLRNLSQGVGEIRAAFKARQTISEVNSWMELLHPLQPAQEYILQAQNLLPASHTWQAEANTARTEILATLRNTAQRRTAGLAGTLKGRLENLQSAYITAYIGLHAQARLDRGGDERKRRLTADPRWNRLRALSRLELLPSRQLEGLQERLGTAIGSCPGLLPTDLRANATCPHCGFAPAVENVKDSALTRLAAVETEFEALVAQWTAALLDNLNTPEAAHNLTLLGPQEHTAVANLIQTRVLPDRITDSLIQGLQDTLQGLEKLSIDSNEFLLALTQPGMPCTPDQLEARISAYLREQYQGKDRRKIRIHIDW